ncbi:MAG: hypothetical protein RIQ79_974 [Verrucomicrobiota bacterium]
MAKKLLKIFIVLALLGVIALVVLGFFLGPIVTKGVNTIGPKITGTKVELDGAKISPLTGSGTLKGLFVGNPEGWSTDKAFYLGEVRGSVQPFSVLGDHIVVNEVFIDGPELVYEKKLFGGSNIDALLKQVEANISGGSSAPAAKPDGTPAKPLKFAIKSFRLQNVKVSMGMGAAMVSIPMPPITITDLGVAEGGITPDQIVAAVLRAVIANLGSATAEAALKAGGGVLDGSKDVGGAAKDAGKSVVKGVKNLFGK